MTQDSRPPVKSSANGDVAAFLRTLAQLPVPKAEGGRLIFALDATMSRQPTWDMATGLQADMFRAVPGTLQVQLVSFRGAGEFHVRSWTSDPVILTKAMSGYRCHGGLTQIRRVLRHAADEHRRSPVRALVLVGDALEESADRICDAAGKLGLLGVPCFVFQEGRDVGVEATFREVARLSGGAYGRFDASAADVLKRLLQAVAAYAAGGLAALRDLSRSDGTARLLIDQMQQKDRR